jgi:hypothetical protein
MPLLAVGTGAQTHILRNRAVTVALAAVAIEAAMLRARTGRLGGNVAVRCRDGDLYTTIWIPGASVTSLRFGLWRYQWCPVGRHWSLVSPVDPSGLTDDERLRAAETTDIRLP